MYNNVVNIICKNPNQTLLFRVENSDVAIRELEEYDHMGQEFFAESGDLMKLVGVLRGIDIHWNPQKR
jgi:hypothetical protein